MPEWAEAAWWGIVAGGALVVGAAIGYWGRLPQAIIAGVMAFGGGVLISALSFGLMEEAYHQGGLVPTTVGFFAGAIVYSVVNAMLGRRGAKHRKRSSRPPQRDAADGGSSAIAAGALLDGIPESIAIGLTMVVTGGADVVTVAAIAMSNLAEGLSSTAGMKAAGRRASFIFGIWIAIALLCGAGAVAGFSAFGRAPSHVQAGTTALAAGAILAMLAETMMPEAFEGTHDWAGVITCAGFMCAFMLAMFAG